MIIIIINVVCVVRCVQIGKSTSNVGQLGVLANQMTRDYNQLASASCGASAATNNSDVSATSTLALSPIILSLSFVTIYVAFFLSLVTFVTLSPPSLSFVTICVAFFSVPCHCVTLSRWSPCCCLPLVTFVTLFHWSPLPLFLCVCRPEMILRD